MTVLSNFLKYHTMHYKQGLKETEAKADHDLTG